MDTYVVADGQYRDKIYHFQIYRLKPFVFKPIHFKTIASCIPHLPPLSTNLGATFFKKYTDKKENQNFPHI